jgi:hypothetical protein
MQTPLSQLCTHFQQEKEVVFTVLKSNVGLWYHVYMPVPPPIQLLS